MAKVPGSKKKSMGSVRAKAGLPAKAGRRRYKHMKSLRDKSGRRQWEAA